MFLISALVLFKQVIIVKSVIYIKIIVNQFGFGKTFFEDIQKMNCLGTKFFALKFLCLSMLSFSARLQEFCETEEVFYKQQPFHLLDAGELLNTFEFKA